MNAYTVTKEINGKKYTAQYCGVRVALQMADTCTIEGSGNPSSLKLAQYCLDHVIIEPQGLTIDDFETLDDLSEVVSFAGDVAKGNLKSEADKLNKTK